MKCRECGSEMYLDDEDRKFKGCYDKYWNCEKCQTSCIEEVRFNQRFKERWYSGSENNEREYIVRHKIER